MLCIAQLDMTIKIKPWTAGARMDNEFLLSSNVYKLIQERIKQNQSDPFMIPNSKIVQITTSKDDPSFPLVVWHIVVQYH